MHVMAEADPGTLRIGSLQTHCRPSGSSIQQSNSPPVSWLLGSSKSAVPPTSQTHHCRTASTPRFQTHALAGQAPAARPPASHGMGRRPQLVRREHRGCGCGAALHSCCAPCDYVRCCARGCGCVGGRARQLPALCRQLACWRPWRQHPPEQPPWQPPALYLPPLLQLGRAASLAPPAACCAQPGGSPLAAAMTIMNGADNAEKQSRRALSNCSMFQLE